MITIINRFNPSIFLFLLFSQAIAASPPFNLSRFIYPKISEEFRPQPSLFLKDVLRAISDGEKWEVDDVRVSKLEVGKVKYGSLQRYDIRFRMGNKKDLLFRLWDEVSLWKRFKGRGGEEFEVLANEVSSREMLDAIRIEGPFELLAAGEDEMSLVLPWNASHAGLKRILVGEDITVEVKNAQEISLFHTSDMVLQANRSFINQRDQSKFWVFPHLMCSPLLPIKISGSASVVAFRTRNPVSHIASALRSQDTIELLADICYKEHTHERKQYPVESLRPRIRLLEIVLRSFLGDRNRNAWGFLKAKIKASTVFRFQLELERDIRTNDTRWTTMADWRTKPNVEREWFEVLARIENKTLKPLVIRKMRTFVGVDSSAWSNLMSNISFTKFPSVLVAPEALTLDVKW